MLAAAMGVLALLAVPARASDPLRIEVRLSEGAPCPGPHAIATLVAQDTARVPALVDAAPDVTIAIAEEGDGLRGELAVGVDGGRRVVRAPRERCADLVEALTFALRMILEIGPTATPASAPAASAPIATPIAALVPVTAAPLLLDDAVIAPAASVRHDYVGSLGVHGSLGAGPGLAPGVIAGFGVARPRWSVALEGRVVAPSSTEVATGTRISAMTWLVSVVFCAQWNALRGCGIAGGGAMHGKALGRDASPFGVLGGRVGIGGSVLGVELVGHLDVLAPLTPTTLRIEGEPVWETAPLALSAGLAAEVRFR